MVKPEGDQQCIFDVFLAKPVGRSMEIWGSRGTRGGLNPPTPTNRALTILLDFRGIIWGAGGPSPPQGKRKKEKKERKKEKREQKKKKRKKKEGNYE